MEITSIFAFNPKLRHYTGLKKEYTVSFKENSLKRDTLTLSRKNNDNKTQQNIIAQKYNDRKIREEYKNIETNYDNVSEKQNFVDSSRYWDLKYNNLL